ncbi:hypothetical protein Sango_2043800 [Sesamum angolense]|uniref:Retrotransposon Copia-like N-terminal domain-containing protein n=1 Tax=Sesamum angolense TaxID=2727404 RepID=A0AAE2BPB8_9LAMI|nr:hypothetical protein Sango_2043800 [Sesamum angolense]
MEVFRQCLLECDLQDMSSSGNMFTWCNNREYPRWYERAILLNCDANEVDGVPCSKPRFRFEAAWVWVEACVEVVEHRWIESQQGDGADMDVLGKIKACGVALEQWNQSTFGNVTRLIRFLNDKISKVKGKTLTAEVKACFDKWKIELEELLELEEVLRKQRGKSHSLMVFEFFYLAITLPVRKRSMAEKEEKPSKQKKMMEESETMKLQASDNPGMSLVSSLLNGKNYLPWSRSIRIALGAKMKLGFINGKSKKPNEDSMNMNNG